MYNNQPQGMPPGGFRPPPQGFPNFPPPGQGGNFPPFPPGGQPPQGFPRPPFLPNGAPQQGFPPFAPNAPPGYNGAPPMGFTPPPFPQQPGMPPQQMQGYPPPGMMGARPPPMGFRPPGAPGLGFSPAGPGGMPPRPMMRTPAGSGGSPGSVGGAGTPFDPMAAGLPRPPAMADNPNFVKPAVKTTAVFIGGIAAGISDAILTGLIQTCGPLHELKRVTGPSGKPQAFGFAEFEDPEVVLRCLKCLNGTELPDLTPQGRSQGLSKKLVVKADEKTRAFLDEYEKSMMRTEHDDEQDESARRRIDGIIKALHDPNADLAAILPAFAAPDANPQKQEDAYEVPAHLKDLDENELPENQRGHVLDQISMFRDQAAKREMDRKKQEERMENEREQRRYTPNQQQQMGPGRGLPQGLGPSNMRTWGGQRANQGAQEQQMRPMGNGPQSFNQPVAFVKGGAVEAAPLDDMTDEEREELRVKEKRRRHDAELQDRERRLLHHERSRINKLTKEATDLKSYDTQEEERRRRTMARLTDWDDEEQRAKGREVFFADRGRWRAARQANRRREYQDDVRDRQHEEEEKVALEKESEDFLQRQMQEMADLEVKQRAAGMLFDDAAPIKLAISAHEAAAAVKVEAPKPKAKPAVSFGGDDDEEEAIKKRRTIIKLDDSDVKAKNDNRLREIKASLPSDSADLFKYKIKWEAVHELIESKILSFVRDRMTHFLGDLEDDDLVNFVIQLLKDKSAPEAVVEGVEPVLDEEAVGFTSQLWRLLVFESAAHAAHVKTGSMLP